MSDIDLLDEYAGLPERPIQNIEGRFYTVKVGRGTEAGIVAITTTEGFRLSLAPWLQDSWKEIGAAPYALQTDYLGYRQYLYGAITGGGSPEDIRLEMILLKNRYGAWRDELRVKPIVLDVCHEICHGTASITSVAKARHRRFSTVRSLFLEGIHEYSRINKMDRKYKR